MDKFAQVVGRQYHLFDYVGAPDAERVVVMMGSGAEAMHETIDKLVAMGEKVGLVKVRLFRPWSTKHFIAGAAQDGQGDRRARPHQGAGLAGRAALPRRADRDWRGDGRWLVRALTVTIRLIVGGRYGLGSNEFNAGMCKAVLDNLKADKPKNHFTVGINDDVTFTSLDYDPTFTAEPAGVHRAMFWGLGSDGTVGANKNSIKIIGDATDNYAQGYFQYDAKKAGGADHLAPALWQEPIRSTYLVNQADFVACHNFTFLEKYDMLGPLVEGGTFLLNSPYGADEVWDHLPRVVQEQIIDKKAKFYVIDAYAKAHEIGPGRAHQHDHAGRLFQDLGHPARGRGRPVDEGLCQKDLWLSRRKDRQDEL